MEQQAFAERFAINIQWDQQENVWVSFVPKLGNLSSYGETYEEAALNTREAILGYIEAAEQEGIPLLVEGMDQIRASLGEMAR